MLNNFIADNCPGFTITQAISTGCEQDPKDPTIRFIPTIADFSLANDTVFPGLSSDVRRARLITGGFSTYRGLQVSLNGRLADDIFESLNISDMPLIRGFSYTLGYALSRLESTNGSSRPEFFSNPLDNNNINGAYGPATGLDRTHNLTISAGMDIIGGFRIDQIYRFATPTPIDLLVPISGGANSISGLTSTATADTLGLRVLTCCPERKLEISDAEFAV